MIYQYTIYPLEIIYKTLYLWISGFMGSYGFPLVVLSIVTTILISPLVHWAARLQSDEKAMQDTMKPYMDMIKKTLKGAEQHNAIKRLYYRFSYHPIMAFRSAVGIMLQMPFLMAAYYMLSSLHNIKGQAFYFIQDLSKPDVLAAGINVLPILMTLINVGSTLTTANFTRKDKIQASVIATFFLVLLYDAPSALLIFWTCNNLWGLLLNVLGKLASKLGYTSYKLTIKGKSVREWISSIPQETYVIMAFSMTICLFVPLDVYITNANEFWFEARDIIGTMLLYTIGMLMVLGLIYKIIPMKYRNVLLLILAGLVLSVFLQSYVININYGVFDGTVIDWRKYSGYAIKNAIAWAICLLLPIILWKKITRRKCLQIIAQFSVLIIFVQIVSIGYAGISKKVDKRYNCQLTTENMYELSSKDNIIVIILDAFTSDMFRNVMKRNPEYTTCFQDFTYYPDATSVFGLTSYSLPQMLTGKIYQNDMLYSDFIESAWKDNKFYKLLQDKNYAVDLYTSGSFVSPKVEYVENLTLSKQKINSNTEALYRKMVLFRILPHMLKKNFVVYSGDFDKQDTKSKGKIYEDDDVSFYNKLKKGFILNNSHNYFKWYHLRGPHSPYTKDRNVKAVNPKNASVYEAELGSLKIVDEFIKQLKKDEIYDNATIVVLADHGVHNSIVTSPLVLVKQPGDKKKEMYTSQNPITFENLLATLSYRFNLQGNKLGIPFSKGHNNQQKRPFYVLTNDKETGLSTGKTELIEFNVTGNAALQESWLKIKNIKPRYLIDNKYRLGTLLYFNAGGNGIQYLKGNWYVPESEATWTMGKETYVELRLLEKAETNLLLKVKASPYLDADIDRQVIGVYINGSHITDWNMDKNDTYSTIIPSEDIVNENIEIKFIIGSPKKARPDDEDKRTLGIFLQTIKITAIERN